MTKTKRETSRDFLPVPNNTLGLYVIYMKGNSDLLKQKQCPRVMMFCILSDFSQQPYELGTIIFIMQRRKQHREVK